MSTSILAFFDARFQESGPLWQALGQQSHWRRSLEPRPVRRYHPALALPSSRLGGYDLGQPEAATAVVTAARETGLTGFVLDCYPVDGGYLTGAGCLDPHCDEGFGLAFRWDNGARPAEGVDWEDHRRDLAAVVAAIQPRRHALLGGRPVLLVGRPHDLVEPALTVMLLRDEARRAGLSGLYLVATAAEESGRLAGAGFDAFLDPGPAEWVSCDKAVAENGYTLLQVLAGHEDSGVMLDTLLNYATFSASRMVNRLRRGKVLPRVLPAFSDWPDHPDGGAVTLTNGHPRLYGAFLKRAIAVVNEAFPAGERAVFLESWNHWRQGSAIEPSTQRGDMLLRETQAAIAWGEYLARTQAPVHKPAETRLDAANRARIDALCADLAAAAETGR